MKKKESLKQYMTYEEMADIFVANYPYFIPNYANVGRFAKKLGYIRVKQMINKQIIRKYVKQNNL